MPHRRRTFAESMLYEEASRVRRTGEPDVYKINQELARLATSPTILNFLRKHGYTIDTTD